MLLSFVKWSSSVNYASNQQSFVISAPFGVKDAWSLWIGAVDLLPLSSSAQEGSVGNGYARRLSPTTSSNAGVHKLSRGLIY